MENNNELLVKVDLLVSKITELEKQMDTLKHENVNLQIQITDEKKRLTNYFNHHVKVDRISQERLYTNGPF